MVGDEGVAWAIMSEGTITLWVVRRKDSSIGYTIKPYIAISNTEKVFLEAIAEWCKRNQIQYSLHKESRERQLKQHPNWSESYRLYIQGYSNVSKALVRLLPYLLGEKRKQAMILLEFCRKFGRKSGEGSIGGKGALSNEEYKRRLEEYKERAKRRFLEQMKYYDKIMSNKKRHSVNKKYSYKFFAELWGVNPKE